MSFNFDATNTQSGFNPGTTAQQTAGTFATGAEATGAGDANKPAATAGFLQGTAQAQGKPESQSFGVNNSMPRFGSPAGAASGFGAPAGATPGFGSLGFGTMPSAPTTFGTPASGQTGFAPSQATTQAANLPSSTGTAAATGRLGFTSTFGASGPLPVTSGFQLSAPTSTGLSLGGLGTSSSLTFNPGVSTATSGAPLPSNVTFGGAPGLTMGTGGNFTTTSAAAPPPEFPAGTGVTPAVTGVANFGISGAAQSVSIGGSLPATNPTPASSTLVGGFNLSATSAQPAQTTGLSFNQGATQSAPPADSSATGFAWGGTPASSATFSLGSTASTTAAPAFNLSQTRTALNTSGFTLGKTSAAAVSTAAPSSTPQTSLGTATNVTSSTAATSQPAGLNFCQLEESINKWTLELEEQEKAFVNQATQVNAWDRLLIANGEKIVTLNQEVERVKREQQQLEHELDYVVGQQRELQDCLVPLEKELATVSATDPEREYTYRLAENLDTQLKQMSEDLKEIIEHLNEANRSQDSSDPIVQIGKILNAHMNSLQWLDQRTAILQTKIQQIDQMHQNFRQEHERSFNLAYN